METRFEIGLSSIQYLHELSEGAVHAGHNCSNRLPFVQRIMVSVLNDELMNDNETLNNGCMTNNLRIR